MINEQIMTIDRIISVGQDSEKDNAVKVGICIKPRLELLAKNEYYQCARIGDAPPELLVRFRQTETQLDFLFERTRITLDKHGASCFYTIHQKDTHFTKEITETARRMFKPVSMSVSHEIDTIAQFIQNT